MADVRKTIEVAYQADVTQLLGNLKKIPGMTDKEAKKMVKALSTQLRQTENAAKKAAKTNQQSMRKMQNSAKKTSQEFRKMKRSASEMGRGLGELGGILGDTDTEMGQMINNVSMMSITTSALLPLFGGLKSAIVGLGASTAMATGGLTLIAGGLALLVANMGGVDEEAKKQKEKIAELDEEYKQLNEEIKQVIQQNAEFREAMRQTVAAVNSLKSELLLENIRLNFELGIIDERTYREQLGEAKIIKAQTTITETFERRKKAIEKNVEGEQLLLDQLIGKLKILDEQARIARKNGGGVYFHHYSDLKEGKETIKHLTTVESIEKKINNTLSSRPEGYKKLLAQTLIQQRKQEKASVDLLLFNKQRAEKEKEFLTIAKDNIETELDIFDKEQKRTKLAEYRAKQKEKESKEQQRQTALAGQRLKLENALFNLEKDKASEIDRINMDIDKQIAGLQTLAEENKKIATDKSEQLDITKAVTLLEEKRKQKIEEVTQKMKEQGTVQQQNKDKQAINDLIQGYKNQEISLSDLYNMENELRNNKETAETALHLKVMEMIAAEHNARLQGSKELLGNLQTFTQARLTMIQNTEDADQKAITRAFYLNQAASAASVAFTTSENIVKALGMAATNPILAGALAATASAAGAAQIGAIMSTPPPQKKHMGGMANDERNFTLLQGEAVLSRAAARRIGEQGIRRIEDGKSMTPEVVVISPFKHYDRFVSSRNRRVKTKTVAAGGY